MKTIHNTLKLELETWEDSGDYPSNAGGGPLPSYKYVEYVSGTVTVQMEQSDIDLFELERPFTVDNIQEHLNDNPNEVDHDFGRQLTVKTWIVKKVDGDIFEAEVDEFKAEAPEDDYEPDYDDRED
jgi:hypothetical protein